MKTTAKSPDKSLPQQAEAYDFTRDLRVDSYLDVKDTASAWCLAQVTKSAAGQIVVHYDGWGTKYDEAFSVHSSRIAPLRKYTRGYSGQKSVALRYHYPSVAEIGSACETIEKLAGSGFKSLGVLEYNQFVRGSLFVLMDSLLTNEIPKREKGDVDAILRITSQVISFICRWIDFFSKNYQYYLEAVQTPNLYLVSLNHAVAVSLPELSEILKLAFCQIARCKAKFSFISSELDRGALLENKFKRMNLETFYKCRGFDYIIGLITNAREQYPIDVLTDLLDPLVGVLDLLKDTKSTELSSMLLKEVTTRFSNLGDKDIKELTKASLDKLINILTTLIPSRETSLTLKFNIGVQLVKSLYIQKKILGILVIRDLLPKSPRDQSSPEVPQLVALCEQHCLLDVVLGENAHTEVLRKMQDVFVFLLANKKLSIKHVKMLWKCGNEKYEDIMRTCLNLLASLVQKMEYGMVEELFKQVKVGKCESEILIQFLESYTLNVIQLIISREGKAALKKCIQEYKDKLFSLDLFWRLLEEGSKASAKLKEQAVKALVTILSKHNFMMREHVQKAVEFIKKGEMVIWCIKLLKEINFAGYFVESMGKQKGYHELETLSANFSIIPATLKDCETYHRKAKSLAKDKKSVMDTDFGTGFTFANQAQLYVDFLLYLCSKSALRISKEDFMQLWRCYIEESFCSSHADILFAAMMKENLLSVGSQFVLLADSVARAVFEELFCGEKAQISYFTSCGFTCFCSYMSWLNGRYSEKSSLESYPGFPMLWKIAFHSKVERIKEEANTYLVDFIEELCLNNKPKRAEITEKALDLALKNIEDVNNVPQVQMALTIIESIIEKVECSKYEEVSPEYLYPPLITLQIEVRSPHKSRQVKINENMKIANLRCLLSNEYKIHKSFITIMGRTNARLEDDNELALSRFKKLADSKFRVFFEGNAVLQSQRPRYILANSHNFDTLLNVLKSSKENIIASTWKLIMTLPVNEVKASALKRLLTSEEPPAKDWEKSLDISGENRQVMIAYYLYVMKVLVDDLFKTEKNSVPKKGIPFIMSIFESRKAEKFTLLNLKCLEYSIHVIALYLELMGFDKVFENAEKGVGFWNEVAKIVEWISNAPGPDLNKLFSECCRGHNSILNAKREFIDKVVDKSYIKTLEACLFQSKSKSIQKDTSKLLQIILSLLESKARRKDLINKLLLDFLKTALDGRSESEVYFSLVSAIIENSQELDYAALTAQKHVSFLVNEILTWSVMEQTLEDVDHCFGGLMDMLRLEVVKSQILKNEVKSAEKLARVILESLFDINKNGTRCKSEKTRSKALKLLEVLVSNFPEVKGLVKDYLHSLHTVGSWRTNKKVDWNIDPGLRSRAGHFVGLANLGATCYMNSSLQQLFMIPQFRKGIIEVRHGNEGKEDSILFQLQLLFYSLMATQREVHYPKPFTQAIKIDGEQLNVYEQKDVDEFLVYLLDNLEQELKGTAEENLVKRTFKLTFANEIICKDCPHRSVTTEDAISLILSVKNKKSVRESLKAYIEADTLEGDNAYYCERCDRKVAAYKRQNIKTLPNTLVIVLKRFEFNFDTMARVKVNDYCEFPSELDLEEFTQEGQTSRELKKDLESGKLSQEDLTDDQKWLLQRKIPKFYYQYKLKGIIVHSGYANSGHYYSYILDREDGSVAEDSKWLEFNDSRVRDFDPKKIPEETFGGAEDIPYVYTNKKGSVKEKIRNAYLLIYERATPLDVRLLDKYKQEEREVSPAEAVKRFNQMKTQAEKLNVNAPEFLRSILHQDNKKFWLIQYIFHPNYLSFVAEISGKYPVTQERNYERARGISKPTGVDAGEFCAAFLLAIALRARANVGVMKLVEVVKRHCESNVGMCMWLCRVFSHTEIVQEFFVDCPFENPRRWAASVLCFAMKTLYPFERASIAKIASNAAAIATVTELAKAFQIDKPKFAGGKIVADNDLDKIPHLFLMIDGFVQQIGSLSEFTLDQYFQVLSNFARLGPEARCCLNRYLLIGACFEHLFSHLKTTKEECIIRAEKSLSHVTLVGEVPMGKGTKDSSYQYRRKAKCYFPRVFTFELVHRLLANVASDELKRASTKKEDVVELSKFENSYIALLKHEENLAELMRCSSGSKAAVNYFAKVVAHIAFGNAEYIKTVIAFALKELRTAECDRMKEILRMVFLLFTNKDKDTTKYAAFFAGLPSCLKAGAKSYRVFECFVDFVVKIFRNAEIAEELRTHSKTVKAASVVTSMEEWLKENPNPGTSFMGRVFRKDVEYKVAPQELQEFLEAYKTITKERLDNLQSIKNFVGLEEEKDSDDDMYTSGISIEKNEKPSCKQWVTAVAVSVAGEVAEFKYTIDNEAHKELVEIESDRIMPCDTMVRSLRRQTATKIDAVLK